MMFWWITNRISVSMQINEYNASKIFEFLSNSFTYSGCTVGDKTYSVGETFLAEDGCNTCGCRKHEDVVCTNIECSKFLIV